jgi:hypothetical protein
MLSTFHEACSTLYEFDDKVEMWEVVLLELLNLLPKPPARRLSINYVEDKVTPGSSFISYRESLLNMPYD